jgi:hypothetical protein
LAHQLQAVIAALALLAGPAAAQQQRPFSHKAHRAERCESCHRDTLASKVATGKTPLAHFSHELHLKMGNVAPVIAAAVKSGNYLGDPTGRLEHLNSKNPCAACHAGIEDSIAPSPALLPAMADCLVCHSKIDPPDSCETCHVAVATLMPANHTEKFVDSHSEKSVSKTGCALCHGRNFTCQGCH